MAELLETSLPEDFSTVPFAAESDGDATIDAVAEDIDRSIYAALVAS
jgi:hypothetical protein